MIVYFNGHYIDKTKVSISPDDRGFLFGDGVYEVIRVYHGKFFRAEEHLARLTRSLREMRIVCRNVPHLQNVAEELVRRNNLDGDATVYIQITRGAAPRRHAFPKPDIAPTLYLAASSVVPPEKKWETGVPVILVPDMRWSRCDIKSIALASNVLANEQAKEHDAEEAIFVRNGVITEGSHSNFAAVFNGQLVTHPPTNHILSGITRQAVLELCANLNITVKEFPIFENDLRHADEMMILGTTTEVMPVVHVGEWQVGDGKPGAVTRRLQQAFQAMTRK